MKIGQRLTPAKPPNWVQCPICGTWHDKNQAMKERQHWFGYRISTQLEGHFGNNCVDCQKI